MSESRTDRVREILDLALERPSGEREAFVAGATSTDAIARAEVMSLLAALGDDPDALEPPTAAGVEIVASEPLTGLTFGPYQVGERIGEGGMGVVYAALDTRLERTVAIKSLPPSMARSLHRRARFEQEARLLATLNHPNIAAIHGVVDTPRGPVLVLEFVPGRTLTQELADRRWSINEAVGVAIQISRGLAAAHAEGIVHRDLKPANIKITPRGVVKILDLGVAKSSDVRSARSAVVTDPGVIVGSAAYMSPEQARGRPVDRRADMWAFGCVLYELLTGRRAFVGQTSSDTLAAVLTGQPDWSILPAATPPSVRRLLVRCIEKDPERRMRDAGDAILELEDESDMPVVSPRRSRVSWWIAGATSLAAALTMIVARPWETRPPTDPPARVGFSFDAPGPLANDSPGGCLAISPDGKTIVYAARVDEGKSRLYQRKIDSFESVAMRGTEGGHAPFFSPDGRSIGFLKGRIGEVVDINRMSIDGGPAQKMAAAECFSASWADDGGVLICVRPSVLKHISAMGGEPRSVCPAPDPSLEYHQQPEVLPGSRMALFTCLQREAARWWPRIEVLDLQTGQRRVLIENASMPRFARGTGMLLYRASTSLMAVAFNPESATLSGEPRRVIDPIDVVSSGYSRFAVSAEGTVVYNPGEDLGETTDLAWFHTDGTNQTAIKGDARIWTLRLSPDASRVAYTLNDPPEFGMWVLDLARGNATKIFTPGHPFFPVWTPDGSKIAYQNHTPGGEIHIEWVSSDGSGTPEIIYTHAYGATCMPSGFSPDGRLMLISADTAEGASDLFVVNLDSSRTAMRLFNTSANRSAARFSPDGRLVAYSSTETGRAEIYIHPYPALDVKRQVSATGGERPTWSADGKRIFWRRADTIFCADVLNDAALNVGLPRVVLKGLPGWRYDTSPDGERFIMGRPRGEWGPQTQINVVVNALTPESRKPQK